MPDSPPVSVVPNAAMLHSKTATVMIVAADEALRVRIQELLARTGLSCLAAKSGRTTFEPLSQRAVDLLLIDLPLPDLSGQEFLKRQRKARKPVPFITLIAPGEERLGLELMRGGALDCVLKDAQLLERLPPAVKRALHGLEQQDQLAALAADLAAMNHLHELSTRLLDASGLRALLDEILEATIALQNADFGNVQLYNHQSGALEIVAQRGFHKEFLEHFRVVHGGEAACGLALQRRQRVIIEDTEADPAFAPHRAIAASAGYRAVQSTPMFSRDGEPLGVLSTHFRQPHRPSERDLRLTDLYVQQAAGFVGRMQAEEALRASEARYRALVHATSAAVWRLTPDGERQLSLEGGVVSGHRQPEAQPGDWLSKIHPEDRARTLETWRRAVATQSLYEIEHRGLATDGSYRHLLSRGVPVRDAEGRVLEWIGASTDITERKRAEVALREREAQLAIAQRVGRIGVWGRDLTTQTSFVTKEWCDIVGIEDPALVRSLPDFLALVHPDDRARIKTANRQLIEMGAADMDLELRTLHPERGERWLLARAQRLPSADGRGARLLGVIIDVTEQKRAEEQLRLSEERLRFAAQAAGFGTYELDFSTGQAYRSPEYKALFGLQPGDGFQLDADQVPIYVHPDDRTLVREATRESRDPQGSGAKDIEYRVLLPEGTVRWLLVRGRTTFEGEGKARRPVRSRGIALDITGRKQLEQEILEISGREQRRIGHDLHDDLCQRLGGLQLLSGVLEKELAAEGHPVAPQAGRILSQVHEALERARLLAHGLAPVAVEEGGLTTALEELADNAAQLFHIRCEFHGELPVGIADAGAATHLYRIAQEAITNAVKHGRAKRVVISLTDAGDSFKLRVSDEGRGFDRTRAAAAGMGLRIMKYRAAMLGATLEVRSAAGQGTTMTCTFGKRLCSVTRSTNHRFRAGRGSQAK